MTKYYLGIDNGGITTKAGLYNSNGEEIAIASLSTTLIVPQTNFVERDMNDMWRANCAVVHQVLQKAAIDPIEIACISCCGHGKGLYLWGKDQRPAMNAILSTDNRAWSYPVKWRNAGLMERTYGKTYQNYLSCQPVALLAWLVDNVPGVLENVEWVFACKDYVRFRLTGEAHAEYTDASGSNLINLNTRDYDDELLECFGLYNIREMLPPLRSSNDICGYITADVAHETGLAEGTPVAGGMFDIDACAIAVNAIDERRLCMIAGTWSINEYVCSRPVTDGSILMNSLFCIPEYFLIEESSPTSAGNNEWFIQTLLPELNAQAREKGQSIYDLINTMVEAVPFTEFCPIFTPFLMGSNVHPNAKASFVGISNYHSRAHLIRGVYEGIAFCHRYHFEKLMKSRSTPLECIRLAGGVARSVQWGQIFADVMDYPVEVMDIDETGTLGCAINAAVAVGDYTSLQSAAQSMTRVSYRLEPNRAAAAVYNKKYHLYCTVLDATDRIWDEMTSILEAVLQTGKMPLE